MTKESDIKSSSSSPLKSKPPPLRKVKYTLKCSGFAALCLIQLVLGGFSTILFLLAVLNKISRNIQGVELSLFFAVCGLICLIIGIYNSFHYGKIAGKFTMADRVLPKKVTSKKIIKTVIVSSLLGICIAFLGVETMGGVVFLKMLVPEVVKIGYYDDKPHLFINFTDVLTILACTNIMAAHCAGVINSLWTLNQIEKIHQQSIINR